MKNLISGISMAMLGLSLVSLPVLAEEDKKPEATTTTTTETTSTATTTTAEVVEIEVKDGKCVLTGTETEVTVKDGKVMAGEEDKGAAPAELPKGCEAAPATEAPAAPK